MLCIGVDWSGNGFAHLPVNGPLLPTSGKRKPGFSGRHTLLSSQGCVGGSPPASLVRFATKRRVLRDLMLCVGVDWSGNGFAHLPVNGPLLPTSGKRKPKEVGLGLRKCFAQGNSSARRMKTPSERPTEIISGKIGRAGVSFSLRELLCLRVG
jgi:hypothetical protein